MPCGLPRSTSIHCGSLNALDHRVPVLPSTAAAAAVPAFSADEAVAGLFWDSSVVAALAGALEATTVPATSASATAAATTGLDLRSGLRSTERGRGLMHISLA